MMGLRPTLDSLAAGLALFVCAASGCKNGSPSEGGSGARPAPSALASALGSAPVPTPSSDTALPELVSSASAWKGSPCRAMRVTGSVRGERGNALVTQSGLDGREWLELDGRAELVVRHGASAREFSVRGPGRVLPCRAGLEQVLIAQGTLHSSPGTGVRPGAEVWVATPFGALRYADADLELAVEPSGFQLKVRGGQAFTEAAQGVRGAKDGQLAGPNGRASARGRADASALVSACERAALAADASARQLLAAKPGELCELAATQLRSRRAARGQCLVAEAGVAQLEDPATKARLSDQLRKFEALWQGIPTQGQKGPAPGP